jgi:hypothetical protein
VQCSALRFWLRFSFNAPSPNDQELGLTSTPPGKDVGRAELSPSVYIRVWSRNFRYGGRRRIDARFASWWAQSVPGPSGSRRTRLPSRCGIRYSHERRGTTTGPVTCELPAVTTKPESAVKGIQASAAALSGRAAASGCAQAKDKTSASYRDASTWRASRCNQQSDT